MTTRQRTQRDKEKMHADTNTEEGSARRRRRGAGRGCRRVWLELWRPVYNGSDGHDGDQLREHDAFGSDAQGRRRGAERHERSRLYRVDVQRSGEHEVVGAPADLHLAERVRRVGRRGDPPAVRPGGLQPRHRARLPVRLDHPAAGTAVSEGVIRMGNRWRDLRASERLRLRGELERGRLRPGLHGRDDEQVEDARRDRADRHR